VPTDQNKNRQQDWKGDFDLSLSRGHAMNCAYFSLTKSSLAAIQTGQMNFFDNTEQVLFVPVREKKICEHRRSVRLRKLGNGMVPLCKCHYTRLKDRYRRKKIVALRLRTQTLRRRPERSRKGENMSTQGRRR